MDTYRPRLETMLKRKLFMLCGNPDLVVERGDRLVYCAGSIAYLIDFFDAAAPHPRTQVRLPSHLA